MKKNRASGMIIYGIFVAVVLAILYTSMGNKNATYSMAELKTAIKNEKITSVNITQNEEVPTGAASIKLKNGDTVTLYVSDVNELQQTLAESNISYTLSDIPHDSWLSDLLPMLIVLGAVFILFMILMNAQSAGGGANAKMMNFGKSRAKMSTKEDIHTRFEDVAGLDEEKEEVEELVDFLKDPKKYTDLGARIPKGVILVGPPGTGKTLLAKAIAGEAGVPFFSISGSDFVEMFVGVGAS